MLPGVSNKHLMATPGSKRLMMVGCQAVGLGSLHVQPLTWSLWVWEGQSAPTSAPASPEPAPGAVRPGLCVWLQAVLGFLSVLSGDQGDHCSSLTLTLKQGPGDPPSRREAPSRHVQLPSGYHIAVFQASS